MWVSVVHRIFCVKNNFDVLSLWWLICFGVSVTSPEDGKS
jgi:hypothetical protein